MPDNVLPIKTRPLMEKWHTYMTQLEAACGELDENTRRELRFAFTAGAVGAVAMLKASTNQREFEATVATIANEGYLFMKELEDMARPAKVM